MKVLLVNGSPNKKGCTYTALCEVEKELNKYDIETEIFYIGKKPIRGCTACRKCVELGKCVFDDDVVNAAVDKAGKSDGFVFGSPVHYAGASGFIHHFWIVVFFPVAMHLSTSRVRQSSVAAVAAQPQRLSN